MLQNIPAELQAIPQWVAWRHEVVEGRSTKVPYHPSGRSRADVTKPATWGTFEQACDAVRTGNANGVGFVLTPNDPYAGIDIDDKDTNPASEQELVVHRKILEAFDSYTERSPGRVWTDDTGRQRGGYHVIIKGTTQRGFDRGHVGVYSFGRYLTFTGDVVHNAPITERQELLDMLVAQMDVAEEAQLVEYDTSVDDADLVEMAMNAANGEKFTALCNGQWESMGYPSQSEADFALMTMFAFYSLSNDQCRRLFRMSALGKREKATRDDKHLDRMLRKIRAKQPEPLKADDIRALTAKLLAPKAPEPTPAPRKVTEAPKQIEALSLPPGLVGEVAQYIYQSAVRPVPEIALAAAIAFVAGIVGRSYNISGTGLNQYIVLIAKTGSGKESAGQGIEKLISAVRPTVPMVDKFVGPSAFASGQALIKVLDERPCFASVLGEFGLTIKQMCDPRANPALVMLKRVLLDLYTKSGFDRTLQSSVYSDTEKNTKAVRAPSVTILGESTPETFFEELDSTHIAEGLVPRFLIIEYTGPRPPRNKNANISPPKALVERIVDIATIALTTMSNHTCGLVTMDQPAHKLMDDFDVEADAAINGAASDVEMQLWNRAHLKALKLAALIAVGVNPHNPVVDEGLATWAIQFVRRDVATMSTRYKSGEVGGAENQQEAMVRKAVDDYLRMDSHKRITTYKVPTQLAKEPIVPFDYIRRRARLLACFKNDRRGAQRALKETLQGMVESEVLALVPEAQAQGVFKVRSALYVLARNW
ncbi:DNA primase/helicase [Microcystis phage Me-ZS1]|nr:DNA primase/helicase [Microcystis phage Me-ZS1]